MGVIKAGNPRIRRIFAILLPTILPIVSSGDPEIAASKLTKSSGVDVPKAITVRAINKVDTLSLSASETAPLTKNSPPKIKRNSQEIIKK